MNVNKLKDISTTVYECYINGEWKLYTYANSFKEIDLHHDDNDVPALVNYINGKKCSESYYYKGLLHRRGDLPAFINYEYIEGIDEPIIVNETYFKLGELHRLNDRPARISYATLHDIPKEKRIVIEDYFIYNVIYKHVRYTEKYNISSEFLTFLEKCSNNLDLMMLNVNHHNNHIAKYCREQLGFKE